MNLFSGSPVSKRPRFFSGHEERNGNGNGTLRKESTKLRSEFQLNSIGIPLRKESRQIEVHRRLTSRMNLDFGQYINIINNIQDKYEADIQKSSKLELMKRNGSGLIPCRYYQQENCKHGNVPDHVFFNNSEKDFSHHICIFCLNLLSQRCRHEAANCEIFKTLDYEFKDYPGAEPSEIQIYI